VVPKKCPRHKKGLHVSYCCVHPVAVSHMLAAEGDLTVGAHILAERHLLGDAVMNKPGNVTIVDGGASLEGQTLHQLPNVQVYRCATHLKDMLKRSGGNHDKSVEILNKLVFLPKSKKAQAIAEKLLAELPANSPLRKIRYDCHAILTPYPYT
jgi:hypothetical protein